MKVYKTSLFHFFLSFLFLFSFIFIHLSFSAEFAARYTRYFGMGEERYDVYVEGLRRVDEEGEGELLVCVREGNAEGVAHILSEKPLNEFHELVCGFVCACVCVPFFSLFVHVLFLIISKRWLKALCSKLSTLIIWTFYDFW